MPLTTGRATDFITFSRLSGATVVASDGKIDWAGHNLVLNSGSPATQTLTVEVGRQYTVECTGSGSVTLSGAGTGTVTNGSPVTVTASTTSLVLTVSGSVTTMWAYRSGLGGMVLNPATGTTYYPTTGSIYNAPRLDYDPVTLAPRGLLVEEQRSNLLTESDFRNGLSDAPSRGGGALITATTFYSYLANASLGFGWDGTTLVFAYKPFTPAASTVYTMSVFVRMDDGNAPSFGSATFNSNLNDFALMVGGSFIAANTFVVQNMGNNIYRVIGTLTSSASPTSNTGVLKYGTNSNRTFRVTGWQLEQASFATSYIPTLAASATRSADVASVAIASFPYNQSEGTIVANAELLTAQSPAYRTVYQLRYVDGTNRLSSILVINSSTLQNGSAVSGVTTAALNSTVATSFKNAFAYKTDDFAASTNGGTVVTDTSGAVPPAADLFNLGANTSVHFLNGWLRQITYIPRRLTNAELVTRST